VTHLRSIREAPVSTIEGGKRSPLAFEKQSPARIQNNILAWRERTILDWLCSHMPRAISSDSLTLIGVAGAVTVFAGYIGSRFDPAFFWLASVGFIVNWFGDSLDGSLARFRGEESPRYGYFLDHSADAVSILFVLVGLGLSSYVRLEVALAVLIAYFLMCIYVFLYNHVSGTFQLSFGSLGPTELRIGLIVLNLWMYVGGPAKFAVLGEIFSVYDVVLGSVGVTLFCLFVVSVLQAASRLRREDRPAIVSKPRPEIKILHEIKVRDDTSRLPDGPFEASVVRASRLPS
jgi:phosphatidylglycerophosphate synthase